jgi:hypothetical protein
MRGLQLRIGLSHLRPRFTQPKAEVAKQSLALPHFQTYSQFAAKKL